MCVIKWSVYITCRNYCSGNCCMMIMTRGIYSAVFIVYRLRNLLRVEVSIFCDFHRFTKWVAMRKKKVWDADVMINRARNSWKKYHKHKGLFHVRLCQQPLWCLQQKHYLDSSFSSYKPMTHRNALDIYEVNLLEGKCEDPIFVKVLTQIIQYKCLLVEL